MLTDEFIEKLNEQIMFELYSGHLYLSMAAYCASLDLDGFANFFIVQEQEERFHAMKFFNYINDQGGTVKIYGLDQPKNDFKSLEDVFDFALKHEQGVTARINDLLDYAIKTKDFATQSFLKWYVDEQVEEEATFQKILNQIKFLGEQKHGIFMLDRELAQRQFTPPASKE